MGPLTLSVPLFNRNVWSFIPPDSLNTFSSNFTINREGMKRQIWLLLGITRTAQYATITHARCCAICLPLLPWTEEEDFHDDCVFPVTNTEVV